MTPESAEPMGDPWGVADLPAVEEPPPLPPRLSSLAELEGPLELPPGEPFVHPRPEDLPEVAELVAVGWRVEGQSPMWSFLPAVWPPAHRCWVPDRLPRFSRGSSGRGATVIIPWTAEVADDIRRQDVELLGRVGLPAPPAGRIWLLQSPWPTTGVRAVLSLIAARAHQSGGGGMLDPVLVESARELLSWDEERVWAWWPGDRGDVAWAWRAAGRTGEDVADLVVARIAPDLLGVDRERGFDESQALAWSGAVRDDGPHGLEEAARWAQLGLTPDTLDHQLTKLGPDEMQRWLGAGFGLDGIRSLGGLPLDQAMAWRATGIPPSELRVLLRADRTLTPSEAKLFDELGVDPDQRRRWVEYGFEATTAHAWTALDVRPNEARVWRAAGHDPASAAALLHGLPADTPRLPAGNDNWTIGGDALAGIAPDEPLDFTDPNIRAALHYTVHDPPGTRGSHAERAQGSPPAP